jgi:hypothetical protein
MIVARNRRAAGAGGADGESPAERYAQTTPRAVTAPTVLQNTPYSAVTWLSYFGCRRLRGAFGKLRQSITTPRLRSRLRRAILIALSGQYGLQAGHLGGALSLKKDPSGERDLATGVSRRLGYSLSASASAMYSDRCPAVSARITLGSLSP